MLEVRKPYGKFLRVSHSVVFTLVLLIQYFWEKDIYILKRLPDHSEGGNQLLIFEILFENYL